MIRAGRGISKRKLSESESSPLQSNKRAKTNFSKLIGSNISTGTLLNKYIKQEQIEQEEDDEEMDNVEDSASVINAEPVAKPSFSGLRRLQNNFIKVVERVDSLEKTISNNDNTRHQTEVVSLLTKILSEMKKLNSKECNNCKSSAPVHQGVSIHNVSNASEDNFSETITLSHDNKVQVTTLPDGSISIQQ